MKRMIRWRSSDGANMSAPPSMLSIVLRIAVVVGLFTVILWNCVALFGPRGGPLFAVVAGAVLSVLLAPAIVELPALFLRWSKFMHYRDWHGRYYEFAGHQVRVIDVRGAPWFAVDDVCRALGYARREGVLAKLGPGMVAEFEALGGDAFSEEGLRRYLDDRTERIAVRFRWWAEHDVIAPWYGRKERERLERQ